MIVNPGDLRHFISIQRQSEIVNPDNVFTKVDFTDYKYAWAKINNLHGKEYWQAAEYSAENTVEFIIYTKACPDIKLSDRINYNGRYFNITFIDNVGHQDAYFKLKTMEVVRSG